MSCLRSLYDSSLTEQELQDAASAAIEGYDENGDGKVSFDEFVQATTRVRREKLRERRRVQRLFVQFLEEDRNALSAQLEQLQASARDAAAASPASSDASAPTPP